MIKQLTSLKVTYGIALVLLAGMIWLRIADPVPLQTLENKVFDFYQQLQPRELPEQPLPVRIVDLDEKSFGELGQWPWPRNLFANLVSRLVDDYRVASVGFDIVFAEPDRLTPDQLIESLEGLDAETERRLMELTNNDATLAQAISGKPVVLGQVASDFGELPLEANEPLKTGIAMVGDGNADDIVKQIRSFSGMIRNLRILEDSATGIGSFSVVPDADGIIRRVPLIVAVGEQIYPALSIETLRVAYPDITTLLIKYGQAGATSVNFTQDLGIPIDRHGEATFYQAPYSQHRYVSAVDVINGEVPPELLTGHIVFIGTSAAGQGDIRSTPLNPALPGVEVHAQIVENMLTGALLSRPTEANVIEGLVILVTGLVLLIGLPLVGAVWSLIAVSVINAGLIGTSWYMFTNEGVLVGVAYPLICSFLLYMFLTYMSYMREELSKKQVRSAFSQYLSPTMVEQLAKDPDKLQLGGEMRNMTLLFSDIRGFTAISEQFRGNPVGLVSLINRFLTPMTGIILERKGTIDKYMGDCIMAFWNAPIEDEDQIDHACDAALTMVERTNALNDQIERECEAEGRPFFPIKMGVGINTGEVFVGNMGSDQRFDYSVIGDDVNLASRLEGQSKTYGVLIVVGESTQQGADRFASLELDLIRVKGKQEAVRIFTLLGREDTKGSDAFAELSKTHQDMLDAYRAQRWDDAKGLIDSCRQLEPALGELYDLYCERVDTFRAEPPGADWDGVFTAETK
ncbi:MAG: adenylate/guanylate cyclase domain-containing protein [Pseudomonadota bacterium]